jgi:hypothetical protein
MIAKPSVPAKAGIVPLPARSRRSPGGIAPGLAATGTALLLALSALLSPSQGWALEKTRPSKEDARVRSVVYQPGNVVPLKSPMGSSLMVVFAPDEHIVKVAVSDEARLSTDVIKDRNSRLANFLFLKAHPVKGDPPGTVLPPEPLQVVTQRGAGELVFHVFGAIAQFERRLIAERTRDGVAAARAEGRHPGRPKLDQEKLRAALTLIRNGMSPTKAARHVGLGRSTLYRELALIPGALPRVA